MKTIVLCGMQWGDEGKGKATDLLGDRVDFVVRYQGGNNAGHTVVIGEDDEAARCREFLADSSPAAAAALES